MVNKKIFFLCMISIFTISLQANKLNTISQFAKEICGEIETVGEISRSTIKAKISGNIKPLSKLLGIMVEADGTYILENSEHRGLPYESLPQQMANLMQCKKEIAFLLISEKDYIKESSQNRPTKYFIKDKNGFGNHLFYTPDMKNYTKLLQNPNIKVVTLMSGTEVKILQEKNVGTQNWCEVEAMSSFDRGKSGWILKDSIGVK